MPAHAALNVDADNIYAVPDPFHNKPFFGLIYFADTQGCMGCLASAGLAADFAHGRDNGVRAGLDEAYQSLYDDWLRAFTLASRGGLVYFS